MSNCALKLKSEQEREQEREQELEQEREQEREHIMYCLKKMEENPDLYDYFSNYFKIHKFDLNHKYKNYKNSTIVESILKSGTNEKTIVAPLKFLFDHGASVNLKLSGIMETYLSITLSLGNLPHRYDIIKLLLDCGIRVNGYGQYGPLNTILLLNDPKDLIDIEKIIDLLLEYGCDINSLNSQLLTPLDITAYAGFASSKKFMKIFLDRKASVTNVTKYGSILHLVFKTKQDLELTIEKVQMLVNAGCNVNITDCNGDTPLHLAFKVFKEQAADIIEILINAKADIFMKNNQGESCNNLLHYIKDKKYDIFINMKTNLKECFICFDNKATIACNYDHTVCCDCLFKTCDFVCVICKEKLPYELNVVRKKEICGKTPIGIEMVKENYYTCDI